MKTFVLVLALVVLPVSSHAAEIDPAAVQLWDVIYTSDGSVVKGVIVEEVPGTSLRVALAGGGSLVVQLASVVRLTKELNPAFAGVGPAGPAATAAAVPAAAPAVTAESGLRIGLLPGVAAHSEVDDATFLLTARAGWEIGLGRWGVTPGVTLLFAPETGTYGETAVGIATHVRTAYRGSTVSPFLGFGLGLDFLDGDTSLATFMGAGIELVVHRRIALTVEGTLHRGFGDTYTDLLEFAALSMGVELRL